MRKINLRGVIGFGLAAALLAPMTARAYSVQRSNSYMFVGGSDTIPIQVKLSTAASYTDGTSQSSTIIQALQQWNNVPGVPQFVPEILSPGTQATGNHLNEVVMAPTYDGDTFGPNILAVTLEVHAAKTARETDVIFNSAVTWDSYRGALTGGRAEIRRVAVHEFGHVLGLDHPDGAGQSVNAIMNSAIGQIETPQADDISGITYLYGIPGVAPVNDNFAQATPIVFTGNSVDISGTNVRATTEAGEPSPTGPGGRSVWWKWTPATTGRVAISTFGSDFDTRVTIATGGSVSTAALGASNDDDVNGPAELSSATTFVANAGTTYYIVVDGVQKTMGRIALTLVLGQFTVPLQIYEPYSFRTYAGADGSVGSADGAGQAARFNSPARVAVGPDGNIYVADYANGTIRKITPAGVVSTFVGVVGEPDHIDGPRETARIFPDGLAFGPDGTLYVAESSFQTIRKVTPAGYVTTFAGADRQIGSADGPGASARFYFPSAITIDGSGNLYVAELLNATIRKITPAGIVSTVAGRAGVQGVADGLGTAATFSYPNGIAATADGTLYVGDFVNGSIRKITPAGVVSTFAGLSVPFGSENYDGLGTAARFAGLLGLQMDASGNLFVTEIYDLIRKITPAGEVTTIAGKFGADGGDDGTAFNARFCQPSDVAIDPSGNLYIADRKNNSIRKMMPSGVVSTLAGKSMVGGTDGALADARFADVRGIEFDSAGNLILANTSGYTVRKISAGGQVSTIAGQAGEYGYTDGPNGVSRLFDPADVATAPGNIVYIAERFAHTIRKIDAAGNVVPFAGNFLTAGYTNGPAGTALFNLPISIASDPAGNVYVVESQSCAIRKIAPDGTTSTFAGSITEAGSADGVGTAARFMRPTAVTVGSDGSIYVADGGAFTVRKITASGVVSTVAGVPGQAGHVDRPGVHARFNGPNDVAVDDNGNIFVLDSNVIRKITPNGRVTTVSPFTFERDQVGRINFAVNRAGTQIYISAFNRGTIERGDLGPTIPYIQSQPEPYQIVGSGSTLTLSVNIAGSGSYQWYRDGVLIPGATQLSLTLANITAAQTGSYYLVVTTAAGSTQSASAFVGIVTPYTFTVQPIAQSAATGSTVVLSAVATGFPAPSSYQWYKNNVAVSGATSNTLTLVNVQPSDAGNYTVNVIGTAGVAASNSALLTVTAAVLAAPSFTQQPASVWVAPGSNPTFTAAVSGTPAPTLQWCKNGVPIPGATNVTLSLSNVQSADAGAYTVVATSSAGTVTSAAATLTVSTSTNAPVFSLDLISPTVAAGGTVTFTVAVVGTPTPTLQWFKNGVAIVGATNSTLKLSNLQSADAGVYTVVATNLAGTITSGPGTLTVWVPTNSPIFSLNPDSQTVTAGSTVTFTVAVSGTPSPTLQWYKNGVAITGATGATLTLSNVQPADAATYTVVATNSLGTATSGSATLVLGTATGPVVMAQPASHMMAVGSTVILSVDASGTVTPGSLLRGHGIKPAAISDDPLTYQWKKNGAAIAGATSSQLRLTNLQAYDAGGYRVTISNAAGSVTSNPATLDVVATGTPGRIINLSVRTVSGPGEDTLIMGFVVGGANTAGTKQLLIRGIGPTLANFGVPSAMVDSQLEVLAQGQAIPLASNDNWAGDSVVTTLASATGAFMLPDPASKDAALTTSLARGIYSAKVGGVQQTTGTVLAEIYDGAPANFAASSPRLINVSARARMANDNPLIAGFVIGGSTAKTVMIRAVGPFLSSFFGSAAMSDPKLELYVRELGADRLVVTNDNWGGASLTTAVGNSVGAFTLPEAASKDAVLLLTLEPGIYSAKVTGVAGASGIVLIEVYELP